MARNFNTCESSGNLEITICHVFGIYITTALLLLWSSIIALPLGIFLNSLHVYLLYMMRTEVGAAYGNQTVQLAHQKTYIIFMMNGKKCLHHITYLIDDQRNDIMCVSISNGRRLQSEEILCVLFHKFLEFFLHGCNWLFLFIVITKLFNQLRCKNKLTGFDNCFK